MSDVTSEQWWKKLRHAAGLDQCRAIVTSDLKWPFWRTCMRRKTVGDLCWQHARRAGE